VCVASECVGLGMISTSDEAAVSCVCGVYPALTMRLSMWVRMLWLHWMVDMFGCGLLVVYAIMLRSVWVPHSVPPG
jgi:hypothetical protein